MLTPQYKIPLFQQHCFHDHDIIAGLANDSGPSEETQGISLNYATESYRNIPSVTTDHPLSYPKSCKSIDSVEGGIDYDSVIIESTTTVYGIQRIKGRRSTHLSYLIFLFPLSNAYARNWSDKSKINQSPKAWNNYDPITQIPNRQIKNKNIKKQISNNIHANKIERERERVGCSVWKRWMSVCGNI